MKIQEIILDETINGWYKDRPVSDILSVSAKRYKLQIEDIHDHKQNFLNYYFIDRLKRDLINYFDNKY